MPFKAPPRDMTNVRCVKKSKDKNGEEQFELLVLFDIEEPEWAVLSEDVVADCKEIFTLFDTDNDGVLTLEEASKTFRVMGKRPTEDEILKMVREVSDDKKNDSLEFNEFLKMVALSLKREPSQNKRELLEAFQQFDKDEDGKLTMEELRQVMTSMGEEPVSEEEFQAFAKVLPSNDEGLLDYEGFCSSLCD